MYCTDTDTVTVMLNHLQQGGFGGAARPPNQRKPPAGQRGCGVSPPIFSIRSQTAGGPGGGTPIGNACATLTMLTASTYSRGDLGGPHAPPIRVVALAHG